MKPTQTQIATAESFPQPARWTRMDGSVLVVQDAHGDVHHIPRTEWGRVSKHHISVGWRADEYGVQVMPTMDDRSISTLTETEARTLARLLKEAVQHAEDEMHYLRMLNG